MHKNALLFSRMLITLKVFSKHFSMFYIYFLRWIYSIKEGQDDWILSCCLMWQPVINNCSGDICILRPVKICMKTVVETGSESDEMWEMSLILLKWVAGLCDNLLNPLQLELQRCSVAWVTRFKIFTIRAITARLIKYILFLFRGF